MKRSVVAVLLCLILSACASSGTVVGVVEMSKHAKIGAFSEKTHPDNTVVGGTVNLRSCPSTTCGVVGYLYAGQSVEVLGCIGNWCEVVVEKKSSYVYAPCVGQGEGVCK